MPYTEEQQRKYEKTYGTLGALRDSNGAAIGSRKTVDVDGTAVTAERRTRSYTSFAADQFTGSYAMSIIECAEYLTTKPRCGCAGGSENSDTRTACPVHA